MKLTPSSSPSALARGNVPYLAPLAIGLAALILLLASGAGAVAALAVGSLAGLDRPGAFRAEELSNWRTTQLAATLLAFQAVTIGLTLLSVRAVPVVTSGGDGRRLNGAVAIAALLVAAMAYSGLVFVLDRQALLSDIRPLIEIMRAETWWLIGLAAVVGAPIAEELLFRGFLYPRLSETALGGVGAAVLTAVGWAALHFTYTAYGLAAIFLIGLYLAWLRARSGGIALPILAHAIYNASVFAVIMVVPENLFNGMPAGF